MVALPAIVLMSALPSCAADTLIPRSEMMTVDELRPGMKGMGKSVFRGTRVESFDLTVLGVLRRIDFEGDLILVRIDSGPPVTEGYGIVSGMSGSPVYVRGKLIGALAYAWAFAKKPIAGVTPIAQMLESFQPGSAPVRGSGALRAVEPLLIEGETIERVVVAPSQAAASMRRPNTGALVPVATPVLISGLDSRTMSLLGAALEPLGLLPLAGAGSAGEIETRIVPGQAVGARLIGGDLDVTAVGTVTYVRDDVVLAFGHPMAGLGTTDLPLVAAYVHGVMPSSELSFKLSSSGQPLGRFTEDRPWCLGGRLGDRASLIQADLRVADEDRRAARSYRVQVVRSRSLTATLLNAVVAGAVASIGTPSSGSTRVRFAIDAQGLPPLARENTYSLRQPGGLLSLLLGSAGAAASATQELSEILDVLQNSEFGEAPLERVDVEVAISKARREAHLEQVRIPEHRVRAGDEVEIVAELRTADGGLVTRTDSIRIPPTCPPGRVRVGVAGGRSAEQMRSRLGIGYPTAQTMAQMVDQMLARPSNHDLVVQMALPTVGIEARGYAFRDLPPAAIEVLRSSAATRLSPLRDYVEERIRTDWVIAGDSVVTLTVEGEEKDKAGRPPSPRYQPPRYRRLESGILDLLPGIGLRASRAGALQANGEEEELDFDEPPPMPTWDEVESVGEREITVPSLSDESKAGAGSRGEAIGRVASIWRLSSQKEFSKGKCEGTMVLSEGGLALAPDPVVLDRVSARCLWPIAVAPDGSVYTGSWADGCLRRTGGDGSTALVLETDDAAIQAVAVAGDGTVYAAAVPSGAVYRVRAGEEPELFSRLDAQSVWGLATSSSGGVWAATGPEGRLYRISPEGEAALAFTAADRNVTALAVGPDDSIYIGTSPLGKVYAVSPSGEAKSICEVEKAAVQSIGADAAGNVFVGTSPKAQVLRIAIDGTVRELLKSNGKHVLAMLVRPDGTVYAAVGPDARVHVILPDGRTGEVCDPKTAFVAAMGTDASGNIYLTAADSGGIVRLNTVGARTGRYLSPVHDARGEAQWGGLRWVGHSPDGARVSMWTRTGATAHPDATWSAWQPVTPRIDGVVQSPQGRYLQCRVDLETNGTEVPQVETVEISYLPVNRSPEVEITSPGRGDVWSGRETIRWSGRDADGDKLTYTVLWSRDRGETWQEIELGGESEEPLPESGDAEPLSESGDAEPLSESGDAEPLPESGDAEPLPESGGAEPLVEGAESPGQEAAAAETAVPRSDMAASRGQGLRVGTRSDAMPADAGFLIADTLDDAMAEELDGNALEEGDAMGEPEEEQQDEMAAGGNGRASQATSHRWDTSAVADGIYRIKVIGTDERANPIHPRQGEAVSGSFVVDNTPPELIVDRTRGADDQPPREISVYEATTYVTSAEFRVDEGEWLAAVAGDGIFDGRYEAVVLDEGRLPTGSHQVEVRARDAGGNEVTAILHYKR